jgi:hypothetical protein
MRGSCSCCFARLAPRHLVVSPALFSRCRGRVRLPLHCCRTRPPLLSRVEAVEQEAVRTVVAARGQYRSHDPQRLFSVRCRVLARLRHLMSGRSRISVARLALSGRCCAKRNRLYYRSRRARRGFESGPGSIPVVTVAETGTTWPALLPGGPLKIFLQAKTARQLVGISVGIGNNRRRKLFQIQIVMVWH